MIYFSVLLLLLFLIGSHILSKLSSKKVAGNNEYALFLIVTGLTGCTFFMTVGGFRLYINLLTVIYSIIYAAIIFIINISMLKLYQLTKIANMNMVINVGTLMSTSIVGCILFHEKITFVVLFRISIMLIALLLVLRDMNKNEGNSETKKNRTYLQFVIVSFILIVAESASTILLKYYTNSGEYVADSNSFFFFTNLFMAVGSTIWFSIEKIKKSNTSSYGIKFKEVFKITPLLIFAGSTICANLSSLVALKLVSLMNVSVYMPITSAIGIIAGSVTSILFREKLGKYSLLAMFLSIIAVVLIE